MLLMGICFNISLFKKNYFDEKKNAIIVMYRVLLNKVI